ncbi:MAG: hypothetical protein KGQ75_15915 [Sphingomonadales bacterium]|nr:hypothetical protein [Sphingomonadales bacterium]
MFPWEEISGITSTSRKFKKVISAAKEFSGQLALDHGYILTLSEARNCLAHNLGIIDERRAPEGTFSLKWLRIKVFATGEGAFDIELNGMEEPWEAVTPAQLMAQVVENEKVFKIGERFSISERELQEICILYIMMIDRSILAVERFMRSSGIEISG